MEPIRAVTTKIVRDDGKEPTEADWERARAGHEELSAIFTAAKPLLDYSRANFTDNDIIVIYRGEMIVSQNGDKNDWERLYAKVSASSKETSKNEFLQR